MRAREISESSRHFVDDQFQGWSKFLKEEDIVLRWTDGSHETMLSPGHVGSVAKHVLEDLSDD